jgi:hypothetical protein
MSQVKYPSLAERCKSFTGPFGGCPIQFEGYLNTGEFVYARARETFVEVEVCRTKDDFGDKNARLGFYREPEPYDAGQMPVERFVAFIVAKIDQYVSSKR